MKYKILYIEDNPDNSMLIKRAVEARGYQYLWAQNGLSGLELAEQHTPHVILLDINLPDIDGYEVARRLRQDSHRSNLYVPIIAITANALQGDAERALSAGCDLYMSKPINIRELWARLEAYLPSESDSTE